MRYRSFGTTGIEVSEIGFGGFAIGGYDYGVTDDRESVAAVEKAWELGVTFFDTADMYGDGHGERLIGQALKGKNPAGFIATKVGYVGPRTQRAKDFSRAHIFAAADQSLRRLQREAIDLYQIHNPTVADLEDGEAFRAMDDLVAAGKVRFWGVSVGSKGAAAVCTRVLAWPSASSIQLIYNLFHHADLEALGGQIRQRGVAVIARAPLEYGMLTGKLSAATRFEPSDHRTWRWKPEELSLRLRQTEALREALRGKPFSMPQLAVGFALSSPDVSVVICGAKRPSQVEENMAASDLRGSVITDAELRLAQELLAASV